MRQEFSAVFTLTIAEQKRKGNEGFTLIELLVTVIIIGILAALALPNLLAQLGKARDTELRSTVGTINRAQQAFHFENRIFSGSLSSLGVTITQQYQNSPTLNLPTADSVTVRTEAPSYTSNATKAYAGLVVFDPSSTNYDSIICGSNAPAQNIGAPPTASSCAAGSGELR